jgi:hypothetical protein
MNGARPDESSSSVAAHQSLYALDVSQTRWVVAALCAAIFVVGWLVLATLYLSDGAWVRVGAGAVIALLFACGVGFQLVRARRRANPGPSRT